MLHARRLTRASSDADFAEIKSAEEKPEGRIRRQNKQEYRGRRRVESSGLAQAPLCPGAGRHRSRHRGRLSLPRDGLDLKVLGDIFVKFVRMLIAPIVFVTIVLGLARIGDVKSVGRIGLIAIL